MSDSREDPNLPEYQDTKENREYYELLKFNLKKLVSNEKHGND